MKETGNIQTKEGTHKMRIVYDFDTCILDNVTAKYKQKMDKDKYAQCKENTINSAKENGWILSFESN